MTICDETFKSRFRDLALLEEAGKNMFSQDVVQEALILPFVAEVSHTLCAFDTSCPFKP